jgi:hypothetical protein
MYLFIFILCGNTMTSMINTNPFFDFTDFQVREVFMIYTLVVLVV